MQTGITHGIICQVDSKFSYGHFFMQTVSFRDEMLAM